MEANTFVFVYLTVLLQDSPDPTLIMVVVLPSCSFQDFDRVFTFYSYFYFVEFVTDDEVGCHFQLIHLLVGQLIDHCRFDRLQEVEIILIEAYSKQLYELEIKFKDLPFLIGRTCEC